MTTQTFTDGVTLSAASWATDVDTATYSSLTSVSGTNTITATGPASATAYAAGQIFRFIPANTNTGPATINITCNSVALGAKNIFANGAALAGGEIIASLPVVIQYDGTQFNIIASAGMPTMVDQSVCDGRLTLTTATPVTTSDVTGAGTLYFTPYKGNKIALFTGTYWKLYQFAELSLSLTLTSGKPYDVWCYDNSGVPTLEVLIWTDDTTRATALALQNGVYVKSGATTRRYLGSIYASGTNTTEDSLAKRYVWNYYNRVVRPMKAIDTTDTWIYTTATLRQARATATNQLDYIQGVVEDAVSAEVIANWSNDSVAGTMSVSVGVGVDSTSVQSASFYTNDVNYGTNFRTSTRATYRGFPGVGRHKLVWLEYSDAAGTTTWKGDNGGTMQSGISGEIPA